MNAIVQSVQRALIARGYDLGPAKADGILGRITTQAIAAFQAKEKLDVQYPGTIGPKTLAALDLEPQVQTVPSWIMEARRFLGLHEVKDAKTLDKALKLDASETAWCGSFLGMVIAASLPKEPLPANPLGSRNWVKFGTVLAGPQVGAVAVFWRGSKTGWQGHVGFVVGHDATHVHVLGGNQSDKVSIARVAKDRLLGYRWPITAPPSPNTPLPTSTIQAAITTNEQ